MDRYPYLQFSGKKGFKHSFLINLEGGYCGSFHSFRSVQCEIYYINFTGAQSHYIITWFVVHFFGERRRLIAYTTGNTT